MQHTTSLEMSKELREAGRKKHTEYWRVNDSYEQDGVLHEEYNLHHHSEIRNGGVDRTVDAPAPLATELLEGLPPFIEISESRGGGLAHLVIRRIEGGWIVSYEYHDAFTEHELCDALGELRLRCEKKGYL